MSLLLSIFLYLIVIQMCDFWYKYKYTKDVEFKEYRTNLLTGEQTVTAFKPEKPGFEHSQSYQGDTEILRVKDLHTTVAESFSHLWYVVLYVIAMGALAYHLLHGFQSAFRTFGWVHRKYMPIIN